MSIRVDIENALMRYILLNVLHIAIQQTCAPWPRKIERGIERFKKLFTPLLTYKTSGSFTLTSIQHSHVVAQIPFMQDGVDFHEVIDPYAWILLVEWQHQA